VGFFKKNLGAVKDTVQRMKRQALDWEKTLPNHILITDFYPQKFIKKKINLPI
jgi:hypothetical protein